MARKRAFLKNPKPIGEILSGPLFGRRGGSLVGLYRLQKSWPELVGESLARRTFPKRFQNQTLIVSVENAAWAQHLSMMREELLRVITDRTGQKLSDIRFVNEAVSVAASV